MNAPCNCPLKQPALYLVDAAKRVLACQGPDGMTRMDEARRMLEDAIKRMEKAGE